MKTIRLLVFGLILSASTLFAQSDFKPGYIINLEGDTIFGGIDYRGDLIMSSMCKFRDAQNTNIEYTPDDIAAYRFIDGKYYISMQIGSQRFFLEYLIKGRINIYYIRDGDGDHYFLDKENERLVEIPYQEILKREDGKNVIFESKRHIGLLKYYMQDAPGLQARINDIGKPEQNNLIKLAEDYHYAVCKDEACIVYDKKPLRFKMNIEFVGGTINYYKVVDLIDRSYAQFGLIGHISLHRSNEKLFFRTGFLFSQLDFEDGKTTFYKFPFQLEYIYPKGIIRPKLAYGFNVYKPLNTTTSLNLGVNVKLSKALFLSAATEAEFLSTMIIVPEKYLAYSLHVGLFYRF